jgi:hypothetical protein
MHQHDGFSSAADLVFQFDAIEGCPIHVSHGVAQAVHTSWRLPSITQRTSGRAASVAPEIETGCQACVSA